MISVKNLEKSFHDNLVLKGISTEIEQGEKVVIVGPSGSGKSTFLRCLNLLEMPTGGEIWFEGANITDKKNDINRLRQKMGMVFQHFNLFSHLTILQNITLAPVKLKLQTAEEAKKNAMRLLERIGLADKAEAYPPQLSGGQKQRIAIVRALAMNPDVMLFDEPTSALDPDNGRRHARDGLCKRGRDPRDVYGRRQNRGGSASAGVFLEPQKPAVAGFPVQSAIKKRMRLASGFSNPIQNNAFCMGFVVFL